MSAPIKNSPTLKKSKENSKRSLGMIALATFCAPFVPQIHRLWKLKHQTEVLPTVYEAPENLQNHWNFSTIEVREERKFNENNQGSDFFYEAASRCVDQLSKSDRAKKIGFTVTGLDRANMQARKLEPYLTSEKLDPSEQGVRLAEVVKRSQTRSILAKFEPTLVQLCLSEHLDNLLRDTDFLLPYEERLNFGEAVFQVAEFDLPESRIEVEEPTQEEIESLYARELDTLYRKPIRCKLRYAYLGESEPHAAPPNEEEAKAYYRNHQDKFKRPAKRCFEYVVLEKASKEIYSKQQGRHANKLAKKEFLLLEPKVEVREKEELPPEFARKLFALKPGEIISDVSYGNTKYAIRFLYEIPEKQMNFLEARPLATLLAHQEASSKLKQTLQENLGAFPKFGNKLKTKLDDWMDSNHLKIKWHKYAERMPISQLTDMLEKIGINAKTLRYLSEVPRDFYEKKASSEEQKELNESGEKEAKTVRYALSSGSKFHGATNLIVEVSEFTPGEITPLEDCKEQIIKKIKAKKTKEKIAQEVKSMAIKLLQKEKLAKQEEKEGRPLDEKSLMVSRLPEFGEEQSVEIKPLSFYLQERFNPSREYQAPEPTPSILACSLLPKSESPTFILLPGEYHREGKWQMICIHERELSRPTSDFSPQEKRSMKAKKEELINLLNSRSIELMPVAFVSEKKPLEQVNETLQEGQGKVLRNSGV